MKKLIASTFLLSIFSLCGHAQALKVGDLAPEIKLINRDGDSLALSSLKGKLVLVDFWASWCVPCRKEHPNLVLAYENYKETTFKNGFGFTIYSVSMDNNPQAWKAAIKRDELPWNNHVIDSKGWKSSVVKEYGVRGIPANFLINAEGEIVAVNLRGDALESKLRRLEKRSWFSFFNN